MDEIYMTVIQEPGEISWTNYAEMRSKLDEHLDDYRTLVYTDQTIGEAAKDLAYLRKLKKDINDKRIEIKNECLRPYAVIETQAKELTGMIDSTVALIKKQSDAYESDRQEKKKAEIITYWKSNATAIPDEIRHHCLEQIWDPRWYMNRTSKDKDWRDACDQKIEQTLNDLQAIRGMRSEFEPDLIAEYYKELNLQNVIQKKNDLEVQKQRILERERQRQEQEREKTEREEQERIRREENREKEKEEHTVLHPEQPHEMRLPDGAEEVAQDSDKVQEGVEKVYECRLILKGTMAQMKKLSGYASYIHMDVHLVKGSVKVCN